MVRGSSPNLHALTPDEEVKIKTQNETEIISNSCVAGGVGGDWWEGRTVGRRGGEGGRGGK